MEKLDKVMITVEQEKALERLKGYNTNNLKNVMEIFLTARESWVGAYKSLKDIPPNDFIKILCGWYEVEQPFKGGDWVVSISLGLYGTVLNATSKMIAVKYTDGTIGRFYENDISNRFKKVTEQWKIMLLELGREKPVFVEGDMCITKAGCYMHNFEHLNGVFEDGIVEYFYPAESRIEIK